MRKSDSGPASAPAPPAQTPRIAGENAVNRDAWRLRDGKYLFVHDDDLRPGYFVQNDAHVDQHADDDAELERQQQAREKRGQEREYVDPFRQPDLDDVLLVDHGVHRAHDDRGQRALRNVLERGGEEAERQQNQDAGENAAERGADAARVVDRGARERPGGGHRVEERAHQVAHAQRQHLLRRVNRLSFR